MNWSDLSMSQRSELISIYLKNGITSLDEMKKHYNNLAEGGSIDDPPEEYEKYKYGIPTAEETDNRLYQSSFGTMLPEVRVVAKGDPRKVNNDYYKAHAAERAAFQDKVARRADQGWVPKTMLGLAALPFAVEGAVTAAPYIPYFLNFTVHPTSSIAAANSLSTIAPILKAGESSAWAISGGLGVKDAIQSGVNNEIPWYDAVGEGIVNGLMATEGIPALRGGIGLIGDTKPIINKTINNFRETRDAYRFNKTNDASIKQLYPWEEIPDGPVVSLDKSLSRTTPKRSINYKQTPSQNEPNSIEFNTPSLAPRSIKPEDVFIKKSSFNLPDYNAALVDSEGNFSEVGLRAYAEYLKNKGVLFYPSTGSGDVVEHSLAVAKTAKSMVDAGQVPVGYTPQQFVTTALLHDLGKFVVGDVPHGKQSAQMAKAFHVPLTDDMLEAIEEHMSTDTRTHHNQGLRALQLADVARGLSYDEAVMKYPHLGQYTREFPSKGLPYTSDDAITEQSLWEDIRDKINPIIRKQGYTPIKKGTKEEMIKAFSDWFNERRQFVRGVKAEIGGINDEAESLIKADIESKYGEVTDKTISDYNAEYIQAAIDGHGRHNTFSGIKSPTEYTGYSGNEATSRLKLNRKDDALYVSSGAAYSRGYQDKPENLRVVQLLNAPDYTVVNQGLPSEYLFNNDYDVFDKSLAMSNQGFSTYKAYEMPYRLQTGKSLRQQLLKNVEHPVEWVGANTVIDGKKPRIDIRKAKDRPKNEIYKSELDHINTSLKPFVGRDLELISEDGTTGITAKDMLNVNDQVTRYRTLEEYYTKFKDDLQAFEETFVRLRQIRNTPLDNVFKLPPILYQGILNSIQDSLFWLINLLQGSKAKNIARVKLREVHTKLVELSNKASTPNKTSKNAVTYGEIWDLIDDAYKELEAIDEYILFPEKQKIRDLGRQLEYKAHKKHPVPSKEAEEALSPENMLKYLRDNNILTRFDSPSYQGQSTMYVHTTGEFPSGNLSKDKQNTARGKEGTQIAIVAPRGTKVVETVRPVGKKENTFARPFYSNGGVLNINLSSMPILNEEDVLLWSPYTYFNNFNDGGKIFIKPENRGKFTALKERTGHSATWFKENGTPAQKKMAVFELNSKKWRH